MWHPLHVGEGWAVHRLLIVQSRGGGEVWAAAELSGLKAVGRCERWKLRRARGLNCFSSTQAPIPQKSPQCEEPSADLQPGLSHN